jgi:hypothetical protein
VRKQSFASKQAPRATDRRRKSAIDSEGIAKESDLNADKTEESDHDDLVMTSSLPWAPLHVGGSEPVSKSEDTLSDFGILFTDYNSRPPSLSPSPIADPRGDLAGTFNRTLSISQLPDAHLEEERHEANLLLHLLDGHRESRHRQHPVEVWDVGEIGDDEGDWESEPDGWNASPEL